MNCLHELEKGIEVHFTSWLKVGFLIISTTDFYTSQNVIEDVFQKCQTFGWRVDRGVDEELLICQLTLHLGLLIHDNSQLSNTYWYGAFETGYLTFIMRLLMNHGTQ